MFLVILLTGCDRGFDPLEVIKKDPEIMKEPKPVTEPVDYQSLPLISVETPNLELGKYRITPAPLGFYQTHGKIVSKLVLSKVVADNEGISEEIKTQVSITLHYGLEWGAEGHKQLLGKDGVGLGDELIIEIVRNIGVRTRFRNGNEITTYSYYAHPIKILNNPEFMFAPFDSLDPTACDTR